MKLAFIATSRMPTEKAMGGAIIKQCAHFSKAGIEITLLVPKRTGTVTQDAFQYYSVSPTFEIKYLPTWDPTWLDKTGLRYWVQLFFFIVSVRKWQRKNPKHLLYSREPQLLSFLPSKASKFLEIHHFNGINFLTKKVLTNAKGVIPITRGIASKLHNEYKVLNRKMLISPSGIELAQFKSDKSTSEAFESLNIPNGLKEKLIGKTILLYTGSLKTLGLEKGVRDILFVLKTLSPNFVLLAVGGNQNDIEYYTKMSQHFEVSSRSFFLPRVSPLSLSNFQQASDLLLMPFPDMAHYREYMSPIKMFEYMCSNKPIIASRLPSITEVLKEESAWLFTPGDIDEFKNQILKALENKALSELKTKKAQKAVGGYSWTNRTSSIITLIKSQINN